ncbi:hypothetical protein DmAi_24650 [Acetobacter persici]|uniref:Uncharacterized protein n=2 Tax=Acetobacter persici TaxID=1076596 RepID=A0A6V8ICV7_9PROT|nr:hypothetical protein DmAi_24650 [Acetobacter persici]
MGPIMPPLLTIVSRMVFGGQLPVEMHGLICIQAVLAYGLQLLNLFRALPSGLCLSWRTAFAG